MNCEQKSGIFLNRSCENEATKKCSNCERKVCKTHHHILEEKKLCEDCYWEFFLYSEEQRVDRTPITNDNRDRGIIISGGSSATTSEREGFDGGFGGGEFGGGGASGAWTDGDKEGFNATEMAAGAGLAGNDNDNTFFYS